MKVSDDVGVNGGRKKLAYTHIFFMEKLRCVVEEVLPLRCVSLFSWCLQAVERFFDCEWFVKLE